MSSVSILTTRKSSMETTILMMTVNVTSGETFDGADPNTEALKLTLKITNTVILVALMISMGSTIDLKEFRETVGIIRIPVV